MGVRGGETRLAPWLGAKQGKKPSPYSLKQHDVVCVCMLAFLFNQSLTLLRLVSRWGVKRWCADESFWGTPREQLYKHDRIPLLLCAHMDSLCIAPSQGQQPAGTLRVSIYNPILRFSCLKSWTFYLCRKPPGPFCIPCTQWKVNTKDSSQHHHHSTNHSSSQETA